jgi:hypothetical protein
MGEPLEAPLYFRPRETIVGYLTFMVDNLDEIRKYGPLILNVKDGNGVEWILKSDSQSLDTLQAPRRIDYPS